MNYLAVATRQSASVIKMSVQTHSSAFKRIQLHSNNFSSQQLSATVKSFSNKALEYKL